MIKGEIQAVYMTVALFISIFFIMWACELVLLVSCCVAWDFFLCLYGDVQRNQTCLCSPFILVYNAKLP